MKVGKGFKSGFKWTFRSFVNVHEWIGLSNLAVMTRGLASGISKIFRPEKAQRSESFDEAIKRLNLTPKQIQEKQKTFLQIAITMGCFAIICLIYTLYLLWNGHIGAGCFAFIVALIVLSYGFRFHFWYFQLKNKKLGCTFKEWLDAKVTGEEQA